MPLYEFKCPKCGDILDELYSMKDVPAVGTVCADLVCKTCDVARIRVYSARIQGVVMKHNQEVYHKNPRRHLEKIQEVMAEPVTQEEINAGNDMLKEREKRLEKPAGTLTTGRPAPKSMDDFNNKIKPVAKKRAQQSRESRGEKKW